MPTPRKRAVARPTKKVSTREITIPPALVELYGSKPRVIVIPGGGSIGVPVDFRLIKAEALQEVMANPEIAQQFQVMIVAR